MRQYAGFVWRPCGVKRPTLSSCPHPYSLCFQVPDPQYCVHSATEMMAIFGYITDSSLGWQKPLSSVERQPTQLQRSTKFKISVIFFKIYLCNFDDFWDVEISCNRRQTSANQIRFIRLESMHLVFVLLRVDGHTANSHLSACSKHSNCDLTCTRHRPHQQ